VDLFTLECVVFEVVTGDTLFKSDWVLTKFVEKEEDILEDYWPTASPNSRLFLLGQFTADLLFSDLAFRPRTTSILE